MDLARVTLPSALAGQDLVPEQALQVQEADEAGRGSSGGERASQRPGALCRLPAGAAWMEPQLLIRKGLRQQHGLLHPQLHVMVPLGAPRSYAATPAHVRLPTVPAHLLPIFLGPGPSCLPVHPPHLCALHPEKGSEGKKKEPGRQDAHRLLRAPCCLDWLLPWHPHPRLNPGLGHEQQSERPRSSVTAAAGDSSSSKIACWTRRGTLGCVGLSGKKQTNKTKAM